MKRVVDVFSPVYDAFATNKLPIAINFSFNNSLNQVINVEQEFSCLAGAQFPPGNLEFAKFSFNLFYLKILQESEQAIQIESKRSLGENSSKCLWPSTKTHIKCKGTVLDKNYAYENALIKTQSPGNILDEELPNLRKRKVKTVSTYAQTETGFERNIKRIALSGDILAEKQESQPENNIFPNDFTFSMKRLYHSFQFLGYRPIFPKEWKLDFIHLMPKGMHKQYSKIFFKQEIPFANPNSVKNSSEWQDLMLLSDKELRQLDSATEKSLVKSLKLLLELEINIKDFVRSYCDDRYKYVNKATTGGQPTQHFQQHIDKQIEQKSLNTISFFINSLAKAQGVDTAKLKSTYSLIARDSSHDLNLDGLSQFYHQMLQEIERSRYSGKTCVKTVFSLGIFGPLIIGLYKNASISDHVTRTVCVINLTPSQEPKGNFALPRPGLCLTLFGAAVVREAIRC
ncbi:hypothetical protein NADFUDRAFT_48396 [Nadsonia fulvescens var. elongata DSM 6958]|uniref:Uncharacterized protein n=1 Tax=Nadsonia fulvescens var. elongata DSM 6958 TaxID=857566 RepID=A0A1E3PRZ6_9ASCO|nr:hypothetical protein NADFUDRAFT_48396 [Nadsonia fulvescens var. elongata DSM 6958]